MKIIKWLLGAGAVLAFLLMLTHIASLFDGITVRKAVGVAGGFCAWLGFSYLHLTRRDTHD